MDTILDNIIHNTYYILYTNYNIYSFKSTLIYKGIQSKGVYILLFEGKRFSSSVGRAQGWKLWGRWFKPSLKH